MIRGIEIAKVTVRYNRSRSEIELVSIYGHNGGNRRRLGELMLHQSLNCKVASNNELEVIFDKKIQLVNIDEDYARAFLKNVLPCYICAEDFPNLLKKIQISLRPILLNTSSQKNKYPNYLEDSVEIDFFRVGYHFYVMVEIPWERNNPNLIKIPARRFTD